MTGEQRQPPRSRDWSWQFWPAVPLYPYGQRQTVRREVVPGQIWTFDQAQGIFYVVVPIRMTVVRLEAGGLLVYAPVAPTPECRRLLAELIAEHGEVKYIILPTVSGLEHKVFVGPFARCYPQAQVFVAPNQWSFPLNLPLSWLGFPAGRTQVLSGDRLPFSNEFACEILGPIALGLGPFGEVALYHERSRTLLVADTVFSIPEMPPEILECDPYPLLFHAREDAFDGVKDSREARIRGWQRICLFAAYFQPSTLEVVETGPAFREAFAAPNRSKSNYFGLYPFRWKPTWSESFAVLRSGGRLLVPPILRSLVFNRAPEETIAWAQRVSRWPFERIIPCHLDAPIAATPAEFRQAFEVLRHPEASDLPPEEFEALQGIDKRLVAAKVAQPPVVIGDR